MRHFLATCLLLVLDSGLADVGARGAGLAQVDIESALRLARSSESERSRFHAPYQVPVTDPLAERLEVITEYRRMVMIAEERLAIGERLNNLQAAEEALRPWKQTLTVRLRIRFLPNNAYRDPPTAIISIGGPKPVRLVRQDSEPLHAPRASRSEVFTPLVGMVVDAVFDAASVSHSTLPIIVRGPGTLDVREIVDFARLR